MTLRRALKRLRLKQGDIVLLRDRDLLLPLMEAGKTAGLSYSVPIITVTEKMDVDKQSARLAYLEAYVKLLKNLETGMSVEMIQTQLRYDIKALRKELEDGRS
jgi:hypothetical protein